MLTIDGDASQARKTQAEQFTRAVAALDQTVARIVSDADIRLLVVVVPQADSDDSDGLDVNTLAKWVSPNTRITITLPVTPDGAALDSDLLHELILHAAPAARKHIAAKAQRVAPDFPGIDDDVRMAREEAAEHTDAALWLAAANLAVRLAQPGLLDRIVVSSATYGTALAEGLVGALLRARSITQDDAETMLEEIRGDSSEETSD